MEIVRFSTDINHSSRSKFPLYDSPSLITTKNQESLSLTSARPYTISAESPVIQKLSWIPPKVTHVKDVATQKSVSIQTKPLSKLTITPSLATVTSLLLALALAIASTIVLIVLFVKQNKEAHATSSKSRQHTKDFDTPIVSHSFDSIVSLNAIIDFKISIQLY
ncbi:unnamed protein product [Rotaria magnacalcarata]|uniref:Uncharacterized protein n=1 Tax=Rotaria magnacalcarata TaxID=392030 RepID=A0A816MPS5_9BILA|nr:unnamed protein product [Rotaria magnacalcarata]CAF2020757.1 unnamed protein product [Rotaria magnacalcarata]